MCDYSLHNVKTRPAKVGDKLTTRMFNYGTRGFSAPEDKSVAVCLLPGTELPSQMWLDACAFGRGRRTLFMQGPPSSGKSIKTVQRAITMRWNFQMVGPCC